MVLWCSELQVFPHPWRAQPVRQTVRKQESLYNRAICYLCQLHSRPVVLNWLLAFNTNPWPWPIHVLGCNPPEQKSSLRIQNVHEPNSRWRYLSQDMSNHKSVFKSLREYRITFRKLKHAPGSHFKCAEHKMLYFCARKMLVSYADVNTPYWPSAH